LWSVCLSTSAAIGLVGGTSAAIGLVGGTTATIGLVGGTTPTIGLVREKVGRQLLPLLLEQNISV